MYMTRYPSSVLQNMIISRTGATISRVRSQLDNENTPWLRYVTANAVQTLDIGSYIIFCMTN
jgi:hypothetical protein